MYEITAISLTNKVLAIDSIALYYFEGRNGETSEWFTKQRGVAHVSAYPDTVYVSGGGTTTYVGVVANGSSPYLRTKADGTVSDNLLSLPVY